MTLIFQRGAFIVAAAASVSALSGCAPGAPVAPDVCRTVEERWDVFVNAVIADPSGAETRAARDNLRAAWGDAARHPDTSRELESLFPTINRNLMASWNGLADATEPESLWNGLDIVAARCADAGAPVVFTHREARLTPRPPATK